MKPINLLSGEQKNDDLAVKSRIGGTDIFPKSIGQPHLQSGLFAIKQILEADLPEDGSDFSFCFATDTATLYAWDGSAWKSAVFA